jgi:hypothetical protein
VPDRCTYDYAIVRVVPRVERGEFVNVGAIVSSDARNHLAAAFAVDDARLRALDPEIDLSAVHTALAAMAAVCGGGAAAGALGKLALRERFHWLVAPRSTIIQTSAVHTGCADDLDDALERLLDRMVRPLAPPPSP